VVVNQISKLQLQCSRDRLAGAAAQCASCAWLGWTGGSAGGVGGAVDEDDAGSADVGGDGCGCWWRRHDLIRCRDEVRDEMGDGAMKMEMRMWKEEKRYMDIICGSCAIEHLLDSQRESFREPECAALCRAACSISIIARAFVLTQSRHSWHHIHFVLWTISRLSRYNSSLMDQASKAQQTRYFVVCILHLARHGSSARRRVLSPLSTSFQTRQGSFG